VHGFRETARAHYGLTRGFRRYTIECQRIDKGFEKAQQLLKASGR
jgi:hypothetical protein